MKTDSSRLNSILSKLGLVLLGTTTAGAALAHHSFGMFDQNKTISIAGTVKLFEFKNPHAWIWVTVPGKDGAEDVVWGLETAGPSMLNRMGITRHTFNTGDKVTMTLHPLADGQPGGEFIKATFADGSEVDSEALRRTFSSGK